MKKRNLLLLPVFLLLLAGCKDPSSSLVSVEDSTPVSTTSAVSVDSEEPPSSSESFEDTEEPPTLPVSSEEEEEGVLTIEAARALVGQQTPITTSGVITAIYGMAGDSDAVILQQGAFAITAVFIDRAVTADFAVGDTLEATGKVTDFNGLIQLQDSTLTKLSTALPAIETHVLTEWNPAAMAGMDGRWVKAEGLVKVSGTIDTAKNSDIKIKFPEGEQFSLYMSRYIAEPDRLELAEKINGMGVNDTINFEGPLGCYNNFQLNPVNAATVTIVKGEDPEGPVTPTELSFTPGNAILEPTKTIQPTLNVVPAGADLTDLVYATENAEVATVTNAGVVTAVAIGKTNITATVGTVVGTFVIEVVAEGTIVITSPSPDTKNMIVDVNNAFHLGLDQELFYVKGEKGNCGNNVGMYENLRLYSNRKNGDGNTLTIYAAAGIAIKSIAFEWAAHTGAPTATFKYGAEEEAFTSDDQLAAFYAKEGLSVNGFSLKNTFHDTGASGNAQIRIASIRLMLEDAAPTSILPGQPEKFVEAKTIQEFRAAPDGFKAELTAVITNSGGFTTFAMEDATAAVAIYKSKVTAATNPELVGKKVTGVFQKGTFKDLVQATPTSTPTTVDNTDPLPNEKLDLATVALTAEALEPYQSRRVVGELTVVSFAKAGNGTYTITLTNGNDNIVLRIDYRLPKYAEFSNLETLVEGDVIVLDNAVIGWYNAPQLVADTGTQVVKKVT